ncbi:hypothetical protein RBH29_07780 [Herbivorax sp. ANBcel31]|uniref:hypothetical protein n=1 Tax=Herbivorax sp. ANBcel31 TaxID=3069754 RepID=UPI0027B55EC1|nr:hypothetical protein [Herbivorax sp. ANBcel31]MDQ2086328.1 hypothetical protein [Herbivorax sp. ANBcel31]
MKWEDLREKYPNKWLKLKILQSHVEGNKEIIDDMEVIEIINSDLEAGRELVKCSENEVVYNTSNDKIFIEIRNIFGYRMVR